jgi:hypothetical protein
MAHYTIKDFNNFIFDGVQYNLSQQVIDNIKHLERIIGVPTEMPRPSVPSRNVAHQSSNSSSENWETLRSFKSTEIKQIEGIEKDLNNVRSALNKISIKNYKVQSESVKQSIQAFFEIHISPISAWEEKTENARKLGKIIFDIITNNKNNYEIYADLYKDFIGCYDLFTTLLNNFVSDFKIGITELCYVDPNTDYNLFCEYTKKNDSRKTASLFLVACVKRGLLEMSYLIELLNHALDTMNKNMELQGKTNEVEELADTIFVLSSAASTTELYKLPEWTPIKECIQDITTKKSSGLPSLTTRSIFKCLDIMDLVKKCK